MSRESVVRNVNAVHRERLSLNERIALVITTRIGTMVAVYLLMVVMSGWMVIESFADHPFDAYPFPFLLFCGNVIQLLLMPLLMVGQNLQGRHAELRAEQDFAINVKAEAQIEQISAQLDALIALAGATRLRLDA